MGSKQKEKEMTYKGYNIYKAFGCMFAVQIGPDKVLGFFTSIDDAKRAIDRL
jgi:Rad3-related DNA helicase